MYGFDTEGVRVLWVMSYGLWVMGHECLMIQYPYLITHNSHLKLQSNHRVFRPYFTVFAKEVLRIDYFAHGFILELAFEPGDDV